MRITGGVCPKCGVLKRDRSAYDRARGTAAERGYDAEWDEFSRAYKRRHPLCVRCEGQGRVVPVDEVHHVKPLRSHPELKFDEGNLMSLCRSCHKVEEHKLRRDRSMS